LIIEVSLRFSFVETNNQAEYEAFIAGLILAPDLGAREAQVTTNSQLVVSQVKQEVHVKDILLQKYLVVVKEKLAAFDSFVLFSIFEYVILFFLKHSNFRVFLM
jgi:ribonuclease HI